MATSLQNIIATTWASPQHGSRRERDAEQVWRSHGLSAQDWKVLVNAPAVIYFLIATSNGEAASCETDALRWLMQSRRRCSHPLMQRMLDDAPRALDLFCEQVEEGELSVEVELLRIAEILNAELTTMTAACVRRELYTLAQSAADTVSSLFAPYSPVARGKTARLEMIALALCLFEQTSLFQGNPAR